MLSYRHAFHAGNHADVLKHIVLIECLSLLKRKEKGFLAVDTHAGAGGYALEAGYAAQNKEWSGGIERLKAFGEEPRPEAVGAYLSLVSGYARDNAGDYPGSPAIIAGQLRPQDRAVFCELHPTDHGMLDSRFSDDKLVRVRRGDGYAALKGLLPPPTRRGLVFIDPSYELSEDYAKAHAAMQEILRRFATGVAALWYPLLEREEAQELPSALDGLGAEKTLRVELRLEDPVPGERGMAGSGLYILNPPWPLGDRLKETLPYLARALGSIAADPVIIEEKV